ncbi:hypothetical protein POM88_046638 [Heracleum sosnowskyi]|uniref:Uncharacterized protein n=1 Tax=Heracleum sosnowskyi TaxID=360622 RepID=A0AAD8GRG8_9APIA|nr:hypothetical protein POM88_052682 [Heracleum sosnowskyi]KAK1362164.1 hypothetical protein POM88_046638 [Heracleum sosnowskyi]
MVKNERISNLCTYLIILYVTRVSNDVVILVQHYRFIFLAPRNKVSIAAAGDVPPLVELLNIQSGNLRELATAAILTLSSALPNKPIIVASGAAPLLVQILSSASLQGRVDAVTALHNLSMCDEGPALVLDARLV